MGSIYRRGRPWWAKYRDHTGQRRQVSLKTENKQEARDLLAELEKAARECRLGIADGKTNHVAVAPLLEAYMRERSQELRPDTLKSCRLHFVNVLPDILGLDIEPVGRRDSEEIFRELLRALGNHPVSEVTPDQEPRRIRELTRTARERQGRTEKTGG